MVDLANIDVTEIVALIGVALALWKVYTGNKKIAAELTIWREQVNKSLGHVDKLLTANEENQRWRIRTEEGIKHFSQDFIEAAATLKSLTEVVTDLKQEIGIFRMVSSR